MVLPFLRVPPGRKSKRIAFETLQQPLPHPVLSWKDWIPPLLQALPEVGHLLLRPSLVEASILEGEPSPAKNAPAPLNLPEERREARLRLGLETEDFHDARHPLVPDQEDRPLRIKRQNVSVRIHQAVQVQSVNQFIPAHTRDARRLGTVLPRVAVHPVHDGRRERWEAQRMDQGAMKHDFPGAAPL